MGLAEEEVLIRDDSGLLLDTSEVRIPKSQTWRRKLTRTICLSLGFLVLGVCVAIPGPTLLDLEDQVKATTSQMMIVLASRSLGYLLGALLGGVLFDCFDKQLLLFCTLLISSVATVVIPWSLTLVVMATMFALQGITMGVLDTGGNVYCIQLWGKKNGPFIQTLHFAFGIGAFVAPLLARPFLSSGTFTHNTTIVQGNIPVAPFLHEHHFQNMTRRSVTDIFEELGKFHRDVSNNIDVPYVYNDNNRKLIQDSSHPDLHSIYLIKFSENNVRSDISSTNKMAEHQILDRVSKREVNMGNMSDPSNTSDSEMTSGNGEDIATSSPDLETSTSSNVTSKVVHSSSENSPNVTSNSVKPDKISVATISPTTVEKKVKKPTAVTDKNRKLTSADGTSIGKHLDDHKDEGGPEVIPKTSPPIDTESSAVLNNTEQDDRVTVSNMNDTQGMEESVTNSSVVIGNNSTVPATQKQNAGISQSEGVTKPSTQRGSLPNVPAGPTIKPDIEIMPSKAANTVTKKPTTTTTTSPTTTTTTTTTPATTTTTTTTTPATTTTTTTTTPATTTTTTTTTPTTTTIPLAPHATKSSTVPSTSASKNVPTKTSSTSSAKDVLIAKTTVNSSVVNSTANVLTTTEISKKPETTDDSFLNHAITAVKNISRIQFAYVIIGLALFLIAIIFLVLYCQDKRRLSVSQDFDELERFKSIDTCTKCSLVILLGLFFFCYMGLEVTFGALVTTFSVEYNHWTKEQGAVVTAIFWGSLATGRGLSIFISRCCGPTMMLAIDLCLMLVGGLVLAVGIPFFDNLLLLGTLILGLGMSSAFPAGISWAETRFHLSGKTTAVFVIGSAIGQMLVPILSGYLYEEYGGMSLMYVALALTVLTLLIFIFMQCVSLKSGSTLKVNARDGFLPLEDDDDETLEMGDLVHFDKSQTRTLRDRRSGGDAKYHTLISDLEDD